MNSTVKRKYNALIQNISSRPATSPLATQHKPTNENDLEDDQSSIMADFDLLANKKRRVDPVSATSTPSKYGSLHNNGVRTPVAHGQTTISNITLRKWTPNGGRAASPAPSTTSTTTTPSKQSQLKYCPMDRDQLIKRLATYQEMTEWSPKPDRVNEIEWAKRGWVCQGKERVRCTLCNREQVVKLNKKEVDGKEVTLMVSEIAEALIQKYSELIVESHSEDCLWRKRGCDDSLIRLPLAHPKTALEQLRQRYDELCGRKDFLPYEFNLRLPEGLNLDTVLSHLPCDFFTNPPPPLPDTSSSSTPIPDPEPNLASTPNKSALALAIMGWQGLTNPRIGAVPNSASCHACLRRLGLWMFKSKQINPDTNEIIIPASMDHLDPLREHRFFCPWKNGSVQRNPGSKTTGTEEPKAGWEILVQVIKNDAFLRSHLDGNGGSSNKSHGRSKSSVVPGTLPPATPGRPGTAGGTVPEPAEDEEEDEETRTAKDKEREARLTRVKSLFNTKGSSIRRRLSRPGSRPATATTDGVAAGGVRACTPATPSRPPSGSAGAA